MGLGSKCADIMSCHGENRIDGEVSTTSINPGIKDQKSVSFEDLNQNSDTDRNSVVAGLRVKVLERDNDGTIRWVKVTHSESE